MPFNRLIVLGFFLVLAGMILPFLIVMHVLPSTILLNFLAYGVSISGVFLGIIGVAMYVGEERRKSKDDDWYDENR
ncbi:MAG: hypothetical protein KBF17_08440 [Candidatus Promineofilum sp.]|nr:hypothetical protein [Promineifilum sp.]MBP9657585.1 hypothetical protein [Promineifilum sp.]